MLRTMRSAVALRKRHGRGLALSAAATAAGAVSGAVSGQALAESASGRWGWPSWMPSTSGHDGAPLTRAAVSSSPAERAQAPPPLSPSPQTSRPVFRDDKLEQMRLARIRHYEEDIRKLSSAEKVFTYFASSATNEGVPRMTPHDLLRAMVSFPIHNACIGAFPLGFSSTVSSGSSQLASGSRQTQSVCCAGWQSSRRKQS